MCGAYYARGGYPEQRRCLVLVKPHNSWLCCCPHDGTIAKIAGEGGPGLTAYGIEDWIRARRVTINDRVAALGDRADRTDRIRLDGKPLELGAGELDARELLLYYKPVGEMTTRNDPQGARPYSSDCRRLERGDG